MQRCRNHKMRNVTGHLPKELHDQASAVLRAAWKLGAKDGKARIEQFASWVEKQHPDAAGSLREGLGEMFTVSEIGLTPALRRCLGTTNVIDNVHSGMRRRTGRVTRWRDGSMAVRWAAAAFLDAAKGYRRIMGYKDLWILKAHLDELGTPPVDGKEVAAYSMNRPRATATSNYGWDSLAVNAMGGMRPGERRTDPLGRAGPGSTALPQSVQEGWPRLSPPLTAVTLRSTDRTALKTRTYLHPHGDRCHPANPESPRCRENRGNSRGSSGFSRSFSASRPIPAAYFRLDPRGERPIYERHGRRREVHQRRLHGALHRGVRGASGPLQQFSGSRGHIDLGH